MARRRRRPLGVGRRDLAVAQANTNLRYAPEERSLAALVGQAREDYKTDVRVAHGMAATAIRSARRSRKPLRRIYNQALTQADVAHRDVEQAFGEAGVGADVFRGATAREYSLNRQRVAGAAARARKETVQQENEAKLGRLFATAAARSRYNDTVRQLQQRQMDLSGEKSQFLLGELGKLRSAAQQRRHAEKIVRLQMSGSGKGKGEGKGFEPATRSESRLFTTDFARALDYAKEYVKQGTDRPGAARTLRRGVASDKKAGVPHVPAIANQLALSVALDMAYNGRVSRKNAQELRDIGIRVSDLPGAKSYKRWAKELKRSQLKASKNRARQYGQGLAY